MLWRVTFIMTEGRFKPLFRAVIYLAAFSTCALAQVLYAQKDNHPVPRLAHENGRYALMAFKFLRIWNGDETDWGLNFGTEPLVLRVSLVTY
jgi:hypothetical protein